MSGTAGAPSSAAIAAGRAQYTSDESQLVAERLRERGAVEGWSWALLIPRGLALAQVDNVAEGWLGRVVKG